MFAEVINEEELRVTGSIEQVALFMNFFRSSNISGYNLYGPFEQLNSSGVVVNIIAEPCVQSDKIDDKLIYEDIFS